mmetsp:Transcript_996/g.2078  ORF Transcript_996/g.2078 Transcript_996/m.2078 type:complete len:368 (-) Transcript_996:6049-7152(-)
MFADTVMHFSTIANLYQKCKIFTPVLVCRRSFSSSNALIWQTFAAQLRKESKMRRASHRKATSLPMKRFLFPTCTSLFHARHVRIASLRLMAWPILSIALVKNLSLFSPQRQWKNAACTSFRVIFSRFLRTASPLNVLYANVANAARKRYRNSTGAAFFCVAPIFASLPHCFRIFASLKPSSLLKTLMSDSSFSRFHSSSCAKPCRFEVRSSVPTKNSSALCSPQYFTKPRTAFSFLFLVRKRSAWTIFSRRYFCTTRHSASARNAFSRRSRSQVSSRCARRNRSRFTRYTIARKERNANCRFTRRCSSTSATIAAFRFFSNTASSRSSAKDLTRSRFSRTCVKQRTIWLRRKHCRQAVSAFVPWVL